jgi:hypothetical protein
VHTSNPLSLKRANIRGTEQDESFYSQPFLGVNLYVESAIDERQHSMHGCTNARLLDLLGGMKTREA